MQDNLVVKCMNKKPVFANEKTKNFYTLLQKTDAKIHR